MSSVWALQDAKSRFSAVVNRACEVEPQIVTRRGSPVVVMTRLCHFIFRKVRFEPMFTRVA